MRSAIAWTRHSSALILKSNGLCFRSRQFRIEGSHVSECIRAYSHILHVTYIRSVLDVYMCSGVILHLCRCVSDVLATCSFPNCVKLHAWQIHCSFFKAYSNYSTSVILLQPYPSLFWLVLLDSYWYGRVPSNCSSMRLGNMIVILHATHVCDLTCRVLLWNLFSRSLPLFIFAIQIIRQIFWSSF